jgi:hypothetical protein
MQPADLTLVAKLAVALGKELAVAAAPEVASATSAARKGWCYLSPVTTRVVRLLCASGWLTREEIADQLGEQPDGDLRPLLSDLVKRGILESSPRKGYMVAMPDDTDPEMFRRQLLATLPEDAPSPRRARASGAASSRHDDGDSLSDEELAQRISAARLAKVNGNGNGSGHA